LKTKQLIQSFLQTYPEQVLILEGYLYDYGKKYYIEPQQLLKPHIIKSFTIHHPSTNQPFIIVIEYTSSPFHRNAVTIVDQKFVENFFQYSKLIGEI